jgi:hypothetical protein
MPASGILNVKGSAGAAAACPPTLRCRQLPQPVVALYNWAGLCSVRRPWPSWTGTPRRMPRPLGYAVGMSDYEEGGEGWKEAQLPG